MSRANLVRRNISLSVTASNEQIKQCITLLKKNEAILNVEYDNSGNTISIEYDQLLTNYSGLLAILSEQHISYKKGFVFNLQKNWYDYIDENSSENALAPPPACCNKPPKKH